MAEGLSTVAQQAPAENGDVPLASENPASATEPAAAATAPSDHAGSNGAAPSTPPSTATPAGAPADGNGNGGPPLAPEPHAASTPEQQLLEKERAIQRLTRQLQHYRSWVASVHLRVQHMNPKAIQNAKRLYIGNLPPNITEVSMSWPAHWMSSAGLWPAAPRATLLLPGSAAAAAAAGRGTAVAPPVRRVPASPAARPRRPGVPPSSLGRTRACVCGCWICIWLNTRGAPACALECARRRSCARSSTSSCGRRARRSVPRPPCCSVTSHR